MLLIEELLLPHGKKVSLKIESGKSYGLIGPNGSGKSLLLKSLAHLLPVTFKTFEYKDRAVLNLTPEVYRSSVLYLPSVPVVSEPLSVEEYLQAPFRLGIYKAHQAKFPIQEFTARFGLSGKSMAHLSSGQKQVLSFLRALTLKADCLLLDEPTSHLDPFMTQELEALLLEWKNADSGRSFVLVSHQDEQVRRLAEIKLPLESLILK